MSKKDLTSIGDVYGKMLNSFKFHNIKESNSNAFGDQPKLVGKGPDTDGYNKALNDEKPEECEECDEDEEDSVKPTKRQDATQKLKDKLNDGKLSADAKKKLQKQIDLRTAEESEEEIVSESKKIGKRTLNNFMSKSVFDKLYNKVLKENFGQEDDTDALGLSDATPDSEFGDEGFGDEGGDDLGGEGDEVTFTLPRDVAQQLIDVLQATLGGGEEDFADEGADDLNFDDEGADEFGAEEDEMSYEEDEEEGTKVAPDKKKVFQAKSNKVSGPPAPKSGKAKSDITDETGTKDGAPPITALQGKSNQVPGSTLKKATDYFK